MRIRTDYPGGNIQVNRIEENCIYLEQELRDSGEWWFYWNFCACGMGGKTITFCFENGEVVGKYGACKSIDRIHWEWTGASTVNHSASFTYTFSEKETEVYFAFSIPYQRADWDRFLAAHRHSGIREEELTVTEKGRSLPVLKIGNSNSQHHIYFTCRHHACESTASYVLEGELSYLLNHGQRLMENYLFHIIPFVDLDGVEEGDQGKSRIPHDHNRDYLEKPIYAYTKALYSYVKEYPPYLAADYHSPWKWGGINDIVYIVNSPPPDDILQDQLGRYFEKIVSQCIDPNKIPYLAENNLKSGVDWNTGGRETANSTNCFLELGAKLAVSMEFPYFGNDEVYSQENLRQLGENLAQAFENMLGELE